jgi:hypothetical protein
MHTAAGATHTRIDLMETVRRWDPGLLVGLGLGTAAGPGVVSLSLRYNPSLRAALRSTRPPLRHDVMLVAVSYTSPLWP